MTALDRSAVGSETDGRGAARGRDGRSRSPRGSDRRDPRNDEVTIDAQGRIKLPGDIRTLLGLRSGDCLQIDAFEDWIVLRVPPSLQRAGAAATSPNGVVLHQWLLQLVATADGARAETEPATLSGPMALPE